MNTLEPKRDLLGIPGIEPLPESQWNICNLRKIDPKKKRALTEKELRRKLAT